MAQEFKGVEYRDTVSAGCIYAMDNLVQFFDEESLQTIRTNDDLMNLINKMETMELAKLIDGIAALLSMVPQIGQCANFIWLGRVKEHGEKFMTALASFAGNAESATKLGQRIAEEGDSILESFSPSAKVSTSSTETGKSRLN